MRTIKNNLVVEITRCPDYNNIGLSFANVNIVAELHKLFINFNWASSRENLSLPFPKIRDTNQSAQPQRLAIKLKFCS